METRETHWYRAFFRVESKIATFDVDGEFLRFLNRERSYVTVFYDSFPVVKHTPKGVWLSYDTGQRFVLRDARKRWACPTKEEAFDSLVARTKRRKLILESQLQSVNTFLYPDEGDEWDEIHLSEGGYHEFAEPGAP